MAELKLLFEEAELMPSWEAELVPSCEAELMPSWQYIYIYILRLS